MSETRNAPVGGLHDGVGRGVCGYRVRGRGRSGVVLWIGGRGDELDRVVALPASDGRQLPLFVTGRQARTFAARWGVGMAAPEVDTLELVRVQHWLADPDRRKVPPGAVLDAWNFFEDLARGLDAVDALPRQGAVHDRAYEGLFGGECTGWTEEEHRAVRELLSAGVELWDSCPVIVKPRSWTRRSATPET